MPIVIPKSLPAHDILARENIFVMSHARATRQDIRPIEIAIVNLMPTKVDTETQLMRLLGNSPLQVNITLVKTGSYTGTHTPLEHLDKFYKTFDQISSRHFDGMIITGAPVETLPFEQVAYWEELTRIMDYADKYITSTVFICWGAQAALYHYYGIGKVLLPEKLFGVYRVRSLDENEPLLRGMNDIMHIPMSRHTAVDETAVAQCKDIKVLAVGDQCGLSIAKSKDNKKFFFTGHSEYDRFTLRSEYLRDLDKGLPIKPPVHYFIDGDTNRVNMKWRSTATLLFNNWLNYVYQVTPYIIN
ncbi:MAG TPA: homoserine O-succinyltransferase [Firmicutes bacterium]|nr:homoserine O-succinyltransferase [Bacillota bacterium]